MKLQGQMIKRLSQLMAFAFLTEFILCWKLWLPIDREFPMMSAFDWLNFSMGVLGDGIFFLILIVALIFILIDKKRNIAIYITLSCLLILILEDITRLQPWVYTQGSILVLISFYKQGRENAIQSGTLLIVALIYIWSGIQKLNLGFLKDTFPWVLSTYGLDFKIASDQPLSSFNYLFVIVPLLEFSIGMFLLISKTLKLGVILGLLMHLFILLSLGPIGHNWNLIVLPWNFSLMLLLIQFYTQKEPLKIVEGIKTFKLNYITLFLFGLLPALNFFGYWDSNLSGGMYSGTRSSVAFYFNTDSELELGKYREAGTFKVENNVLDDSKSKTWFIYWSIFDIKVPFYPAERYYKRFGRKLCEQAKTPSKSGIEIITRSKFTGKQIITKCDCLDLLKPND